jgi:hypothetical protein
VASSARTRSPGGSRGRTRFGHDGVAGPCVRLRLRSAPSQPAHGARTAERAGRRTRLRRRALGALPATASAYRPRDAARHAAAPGTPLALGRAASWDATTGRLTHDLRLDRGGGSSGARPACALKPAIQWIGYAGYQTARRGPVREDARRTSSRGSRRAYGPSGLIAPCTEFMAFPAAPSTAPEWGSAPSCPPRARARRPTDHARPHRHHRTRSARRGELPGRRRQRCRRGARLALRQRDRPQPASHIPHAGGPGPMSEGPLETRDPAVVQRSSHVRRGDR